MKTIEVLYPEFCHLYAETFNAEVLAKCSSEIKLTETDNRSVPQFVQGKADMVYIGACSETKQELMLEKLLPFKEEIRKAIENGVIFLVTGNAPELFGEYIADGERKIPGLGIFPFYAKRIPGGVRHNSQFIASFGDIPVLGHKSQFSFAYPLEGGKDIEPSFLDIKKGVGMNPESSKEGIYYRNFFATYSLGPFLILNPEFTKYLLRLLGVEDKLCFEKEYKEAAEYRLAKLSQTLK